MMITGFGPLDAMLMESYTNANKVIQIIEEKAASGEAAMSFGEYIDKAKIDFESLTYSDCLRINRKIEEVYPSKRSK